MIDQYFEIAISPQRISSDAKKSVWVPDGEGGFDEAMIDTIEGEKVSWKSCLKINFLSDDDNISTAFPVLEIPQKIIQEKTIGLSGKKRISSQDDEVTKKFEEIIKIYQSSTAIREFSAYSGIPTFYPERN